MQLLIGEEREKMLIGIESFYRPQLEERDLGSHTSAAAVVTLHEMERLLTEDLEACPQCAPQLGTITTAPAFIAAWNRLRRDQSKPLLPDTLWMPESDLVIRSAAQQSVGMTADQLTRLVSEAVRAASAVSRKTTITRRKDGRSSPRQRRSKA
jgi:hypothetical protein